MRHQDVDTTVYHELENVVADNLQRHLTTSKEWFPHEYVRWSKGRDFDGQPWQPSDSALPEVARTSLIVNLLTEDNLPSYHFEVGHTLGRDGAWAQWLHRWTAEEDRHSIAIRDYLVVTRGVDPVALERARMAHMSHGFDLPYRGNVLHTVAYLVLQELATRIAHRNTGRISADTDCERLLNRIALDENLHMLFYRDLLATCFELLPDQTLTAVRDVVATFEMPGRNLPGFRRSSLEIARAGIYGPGIHHDQVVQPVLRSLGVFESLRLSPDGEQAREELAELVGRLDRVGRRFEERRMSAAAQRDDRR